LTFDDEDGGTTRRGPRTTGVQSSRGSRAASTRSKLHRENLTSITKAVRTGTFRDVRKACERAKAAGEGVLNLRDDMVLNLAMRPARDRDSADSVKICEYLVRDLGLDFDVQDEVKQTPLFHTVAKDLSALSASLISLNADVNHSDARSETPMYVAAKAGSYGCVQELLENHASCNIGNQKGMTPLRIATQGGKLEVMQLLLDNGAVVNAADNKGRTSLFYAKTPESCEMLLQADADVNAQDAHGKTALFSAATDGHEGLTNVLLQWKADVNIADENKQTALHFATHKNQLAMVKMLFDSAADPTRKDSNGVAPKDLALEPRFKPTKEMSKLYKKFMQVWKPGKSEGREAAARRQRDEPDNTAGCRQILEIACNGLMEAPEGDAHRGKFEQLIEVALRLGTDVNVSLWPEGRTALGEAVLKESSDTCRFLLERRADPNRPDANGCTPLFHAASRNVDLKICRMLIAHDADVNHLDNKGRSCLFNAAASGHGTICEFLMEQSSNPNITDNKEHTALIEAVLAGHSTIALLLFRNTEVAVGHNISTDELSIVGEKAKSLGLDDISSFFLKMKAEQDQDKKALTAASDDEVERASADVARRSKTRPQAPTRGPAPGMIEQYDREYPPNYQWYVLDHVAADNSRLVSGSHEDLQLIELGMQRVERTALSDAGDKVLLDFLQGRNMSLNALKRQRVR